MESRLCESKDFDTREYRDVCAALGERPRMHRKQWEFYFIVRALEQRGMLVEGKTGLGFGVGTEPLPSLFAHRGVRVTATDQAPSARADQGWISTNQHAQGDPGLLYKSGACPDRRSFDRNVTQTYMDMNELPTNDPAFVEKYDFVWSSCALEHLGTLDLGLEFVRRSLEFLRPGGVAVHTTEYNVSSNEDTADRGGTVIYRERDLRKFLAELRDAGFVAHDLADYRPTPTSDADAHVDTPPYSNDMHLKLKLLDYVSTSVGFVVEKPAKAAKAKA